MNNRIKSILEYLENNPLEFPADSKIEINIGEDRITSWWDKKTSQYLIQSIFYGECVITTVHKTKERALENMIEALKKRITCSHKMQKQLNDCLETAYCELVEARKIAALSNHESYAKIGDALECIESAFILFKIKRKDERKN